MRRSLLAIGLVVAGCLAAPEAQAQRYVSMKPTNRPWTDHPFQICRDNLISEYQTSQYRAELMMQALKRAGVEMIRFEIPWMNLEPGPKGVIDWRRVDHVVDLCERYEIDLLPIFLSCPLSSGSGLTGKLHPAAGPDYEHFVMKFFDRYYPRVEHAELGNEPGQIYFVDDMGWGGSHYKYFETVFIPTAVSLRAAYPNLTILNGGTFRALPDELFWNLNIPALGGRQHRAADYIDVFSVHYVNSAADFQTMRNELNSQGYPHVEIWNTECDYFDNWRAQPWGYQSLVNQTVPGLVARHFEYTDVDGWQFHIDPSDGYRFGTVDDGGILTWDFDPNHQNYLDFTSVSGGPYNIDAFAPDQGVAFADYEVIRGVGPGSSWSRDLKMFNIGRQGHRIDFTYTKPGLGPSQSWLTGQYSEQDVTLSGTVPTRGSERLLALGRSYHDPRQADISRVVVRGAPGTVLNGLASYAPEFARAFDGNGSTTIVTGGRPTDIEMTWPRAVRIEQIELHVAAGDLVDTASSFVELDFFDGGEWFRLGHMWAKEYRESSGPAAFWTRDDGESIQQLPFTTKHIRLRFWQKCRISEIKIRGNDRPGDVPPRTHLERVAVEYPDPGWEAGWALEGWIYDPNGLDQPRFEAALEWNGPNDVFWPLLLARLQIGAPLPYFDARFTSRRLVRFRFTPWAGFPEGPHSWVMRVRGHDPERDFALVTIPE